jgi:hypothetical protein
MCKPARLTAGSSIFNEKVLSRLVDSHGRFNRAPWPWPLRTRSTLDAVAVVKAGNYGLAGTAFSLQMAPRLWRNRSGGRLSELSKT